MNKIKEWKSNMKGKFTCWWWGGHKGFQKCSLNLKDCPDHMTCRKRLGCIYKTDIIHFPPDELLWTFSNNCLKILQTKGMKI